MHMLFLCIPVLAALLAAMRPAWAESVGELLPVAIPGFGAAPGVSALSRLHRGYFARPVTFGGGLRGLEIFPSFGLEAGFDTAPGAGQAGSALAALRPAVRIADRALGLTGYFGGMFDRYARTPAADANQVTAAVGLGVPVGMARLTAAAAHVERSESALGLASGGSAAPLDVTADDARIALRAGFGSFTATGRLSVGEQAVSARGGILPGFERRGVVRGETGLETPAGGRLRELVMLRASETHYDGALPGSGFADATGLGVLAGVETGAADVWRLRLVGGAERQHFAAGGPASEVIAVYDAALGWTPDPLVSLDLDFARATATESSFGAEGTVVTTERLGVAEAYARDLLLTATASARQGVVAGRQAGEIDLDAGARWRLSRGFAVEPAASLALRHDLAGAAPREARLTVSLAWTP